MDGLVDGEGRVERSGVRLDSVYFDTEDHDLLARGITLRCRTGDTDNGWQLKVPTGDARTEIRLDPTGTQTTVPKELATLVTGMRRGKALRHIVTVRTDRTAHRLLNGNDELIVEVADDHVDAVAPGRGAATLSSWREIEAELGPAATEHVLTAVGGALTEAGATPSASPNKVAKALGITDTTEAGGSPAGRARTAGDVIRRYLAEQDDALVTGDLGLRRGLDGMIHPTRVATRIEDYLWAEQVQRRQALDKAMNGRRYLALLRESQRWVTDPPFTDLAARNPGELKSAVRAAAKKVSKHLAAGLGPGGDDEELHKARKAGKRARYAAELAHPVLGKKT